MPWGLVGRGFFDFSQHVIDAIFWTDVMARRLKVLVIDDDRDLADSLVELLDLHGYRAAAAYGGDEGLRRFQAESFDVAIVDVRMPGKTGIECAGEISRLNPRVRVLLMTAFRDEPALRPVEGGESLQILNKPLDTTVLLDRLRSIEPVGIVLLVDDDVDVRASLEKVLSDRGYKVLVAGTGGDAVNIALAEAVEILLLDLRLPDFNGAEVFFRLRDRGRELPTIVITGYAVEEAESIARLRQANRAVCLTKPIHPDALSDAVEHALRDVS
jgi:DNA-binding response OmpR family regulator